MWDVCGARALAPIPNHPPPRPSRLKDLDESFFPWASFLFPLGFSVPICDAVRGSRAQGRREVTWQGRACLRALPLLGAWRVLPAHTCLCFPWGSSHDLCGPQGHTCVKAVPPACGHSPGGRIVTTQPKAFPPWEAPPLALNRPGVGEPGGFRWCSEPEPVASWRPAPTLGGLECLAGLDRPTHACWKPRPTFPPGGLFLGPGRLQTHRLSSLRQAPHPSSPLPPYRHLCLQPPRSPAGLALKPLNSFDGPWLLNGDDLEPL